MPNRTIIHIDMDAFYASVEQLDFPEYRGKPVIVGADPKGGKGRGVVSAASYEAREFGVRSALPISQAFKKCPHGIFVRGRMKRYVEISKKIMTIFHQYTPYVEPISLDEAFLDISGTERLLGKPDAIGHQIKDKIKTQTGLTASVGIGPTKMIAKIASDLDKPNGFVYVCPEEVKSFLHQLPVNRLWGVGKVTCDKLNQLGIQTVGDLARLKMDFLEETFGKGGKMLYHYAHGKDESPVIADREAKSVSNETTFSQDTMDQELIRHTLHHLSEKVAYRLRKQELCGKTVTLKVRWDDFSTHIRHSSLHDPVNLGEDIFQEILTLWDRFHFRDRPIRLLGVGVTNIMSVDECQGNLFDMLDKRKDATQAMDSIRQKFGEKVIRRGG